MTLGLACIDCGKVRHPRSATSPRPRCRSCAMRERRRLDPRFQSSGVLTMDSVQAAWVGAMLEAEGCICVRKDKRRGYDGVQLTVTNTEMKTLERCLAFVGAGRIVPQSKATAAQSLGNKPVFLWIITRRREIRDLLCQVIPHLTGKQEKATNVLQRVELETACSY